MSLPALPTIGSLLVAPGDSGPRAADVLCVFDEDADTAGALLALVLNQPTEQPAQPLAFGLFDCGDGVAWWGGPTTDVFALVELPHKASHDDEYLPSGEPRRYVTAHTGIWMPGRDHPPSAVNQVRVFYGAVWLPPDQGELYRRDGFVLAATDDLLFDAAPATLADRLRTMA